MNRAAWLPRAPASPSSPTAREHVVDWVGCHPFCMGDGCWFKRGRAGDLLFFGGLLHLWDNWEFRLFSLQTPTSSDFPEDPGILVAPWDIGRRLLSARHVGKRAPLPFPQFSGASMPRGDGLLAVSPGRGLLLRSEHPTNTSLLLLSSLRMRKAGVRRRTRAKEILFLKAAYL